MKSYGTKEFLSEYGNLIITMDAKDIYELLGEEIKKLPSDEMGSVLKHALVGLWVLASTMDANPEGDVALKLGIIEMVGSLAIKSEQALHVFCLGQAFQLASTMNKFSDSKKIEIIAMARDGEHSDGAVKYDIDGVVKL